MRILEKLKKQLDAYFQGWNEGCKKQDGEIIRSFLSNDFVGYWAHSSILEPTPYFYSYDLQAVVEQMVGAKKTFTIYSMVPRKNETEWIVVGQEICQIQGQEHPAQCMLIWRNEQNEWKLLREYIELEK